MEALAKAKNWAKQSITLKLITIAIIMLCLLIPKSMITSLIYERQESSQTAKKEVSSKWANNQIISGPILTLPVEYNEKFNNEKDDDDVLYRTKTSYLRILPKTLNIDGSVTPTERNRGIYKILLYESDIYIDGSFVIPEIQKDDLTEIFWDQAYITMAISDLRGIKDEVRFELNEESLPVESGSKIRSYKSGITIACPNLESIKNTEIDYSVKLQLQGSERLDFTPDGDITKVNIQSSWPDPSFDGYVLPDNREITEDGFSAQWKLLQLNRGYPSSWYDDLYFSKQLLSQFGFTIYESNDHYQKSIRSIKYGAMIISLNFLIFFIVELLNKNRIHPFQYILIGLALTLFFSVLLALSEHMSYNLSYAISSAIIVVLVTLYSKSVLGRFKLASMIGLLLSGIYGFLYFTLQSHDYALLIGSLGLTAILGITMYFTRNFQWYDHNLVRPFNND